MDPYHNVYFAQRMRPDMPRQFCNAWLQRYIADFRQDMARLCTEDKPNFRGIGGAMRTAGLRQLELCLELLDGGVARGDLRSMELVGSEARCSSPCRLRRPLDWSWI